MIKVTNTGSHGYRIASVDWMDLTSDWTRSTYVRYDTDAIGTDYYASWVSGDSGLATAYIELYASLVTAVFTLSVDFNIGGLLLTLSSTISDATTYYVTVRYNATTHLAELLIDGVVVDFGTVNLNAFPTVVDDFILNDGGGIAGGSIGYDMMWSRVLDNTEIITQMSSITPINQTMLLYTCPLQTSVDLTDHNGKLRLFLAFGPDIVTNTTDPLLSVVAGPPTNTTPATAIELTLDSAYFQDMVSSGSAVAAGWYFVTATRDEFWGMCAFGDLTTYKPSMTVYEGLANANANIHYQELTSDLNSPMQGNVTAGNDYYFKVARNSAVSPAVNKISIIKALELPVPVGSIMINDDVLGYIAALDVNTGYPIHFFLIPLNPSGEGGCPLSDGTIILCKNDTTQAAIYDNQFNLVSNLASLTAPPTFDIASSNLQDTFAIGTWPLGTVVRLISAGGVIDPTIYDTSISTDALGLNVNVTKFYFAASTAFNAAIKTWDILSNSAASDLFAGVVTELTSKGPIIVLQDGKIVLPRVTNASPKHFVLKIVNDIGTLLHTYDLGPCRTPSDNRLATAVEDPTYVWAWGKQDDAIIGRSFFNKVKVSDGSLAVDLRGIVQYEDGRYNASDAGETDTPIRFGHSESCPFWINRVELFSDVVERSGIYYLTGTGSGNPTQRHDTLWIDASIGTTEDVKIP